MKYKVGDKVKVKNEFDFCEEYRGEQFVIEECDSSDDTYFCHLITGGYGIWFSEEKLEPLVPTLAEIKEKKLSCVIHTKTKREAIMLVEILGVDEERLYDKNDFIECWDGHKENTCYRIRNGKVDQMDCIKFYQNINEEIYEFPDLFAAGGVAGARVLSDLFTAWEQSRYSPEFMEKAIQRCDKVCRLKFKNGSSIEALPQKDDIVRGENHFCTGFESPYLDLSAFLNDGISAKNGGKNSMKFTFYVKEGTRPDKKCNGTIPTMTTNIELFNGNVFDEVTTIKGSATCDKADYDERQGVLEALANAVCGGEFEKRYKKAVKINKDADLWMRTCCYCGKVFDTIEEKVAHDDWHVERKKARHERYLLRKRAKEIAFEEQAQKLAKEIIAEDNKK